jgi:hypothetical protein
VAAASTEAKEKPETLTKAQVIKLGDVICEKTDAKQEERLQSYEKQHPKAQLNQAEREKAVVAVALPPILVEAGKLAALTPPARDTAELQAIVTKLEEAVKRTEDTPSIAVVGSKSPFDEAGELAQRYGFKICNAPS